MNNRKFEALEVGDMFYSDGRARRKIKPRLGVDGRWCVYCGTNPSMNAWNGQHAEHVCLDQDVIIWDKVPVQVPVFC